VTERDQVLDQTCDVSTTTSSEDSRSPSLTTYFSSIPPWDASNSLSDDYLRSIRMTLDACKRCLIVDYPCSLRGLYHDLSPVDAVDK